MSDDEVKELKSIMWETYRKVEGLDKKITEVTTILLGVSGSSADGIVGKVKRQSESINKLWVAIFILASSIGGGAYGIIKLLT